MPNNGTESSGLYPDDMVAAQVAEDEGPETSTSSTETTEAGTYQSSQTDLAVSETDQNGTEPADDQMAFIENGLTKNEAITLIGVTVPSYALAAFILQQMNSHGIHHAPPALWVIFGILVIIPIALLFGTSLATRLLEQITNARRNHK